jgi:hypothetical protein
MRKLANLAITGILALTTNIGCSGINPQISPEAPTQVSRLDRAEEILQTNKEKLQQAHGFIITKKAYHTLRATAAIMMGDMKVIPTSNGYSAVGRINESIYPNGLMPNLLDMSDDDQNTFISDKEARETYNTAARLTLDGEFQPQPSLNDIFGN